MKDSIRTPLARWTSWLTISGSLVCLAGCAQLTGPASAPSWHTPPPPLASPPAAATTGAAVNPHSAPAVSLASTTGVPAVAHAGFIEDPASPAATGAAAVALDSGQQPAATPTDDRYIARQYPTDNSVVLQDPSSVPATGLVDPYAPTGPYATYQGPQVREADLVINGFPARTGRIMLGGAVNSDAGVTGQLTIDERNFDITRWPRSFQDLFSGTAFRGAGQTFRIEAAPGSDFQRYTAQFADPNLFGYKPVSMSISGFLYDRRFNDWDEQRLGGRLAFGYRITPDLSISVGGTGQHVDITRPRASIQELTEAMGGKDLYSGEVALKHDTRDSPIQSSRGHYFEFKFEEVFGDFDYARFETEYRKYWLLTQRADGSGRQTLSYSTQVGFSGDDTPIFENFFAGGYATLRGFDFRGASPVDPTTGVELGGRFQWLNSVEYMFPITADDAFRGVTFVDFGTVEQEVEINEDNFRVAPGVGLRVAIPMLGPAPLAFDFAYPITKAETDDRRIFSFYMSLIR